MYSPDTLQRLNDEAVAKYLAQTESGERTCDYCNRTATHSIPVYNPADSVRNIEGAYSVIHVCDEHHDNGSYMEELFYCDGCGELFVTHHSWDVQYVEKDGEMFCQNCALERMEPVTLLELLDDIERGDMSKWMLANAFPGKELLWEGEFSEWSDFPGHTNLKSVREEILQAACENGLGEDSEVYPLVTHGYQFSVALGVYYSGAEAMKKRGRVGTIARLDYQFPSGIAVLAFTNGKLVYVESGCGLRALASCFGATEGKGDLLEKIFGRKIRYETDFMNVMEWFSPIEKNRR